MKFILAAALAFVGASPALATVYNCQARNGNFATEFQITVSDDGGASVVDAVAQNFREGPVDAVILNESDRIIAFAWTVENALDRRAQYARLRYTATIDKARSSVRLRVKPMGYSNFFSSRGPCRSTA
ncbi:MAG: hypothetical protein QNJ13_16875 [Paracoccaceae bacterium]|nr:hypothetical protein [Paracoccaceae bacterium]